MSPKELKEMQAREKSELQSSSEQTTPGPIFTPPVDILETEEGLTLIADMPGAKSDKIDINLNKNILKISADVEPFENAEEEDLLVEFEVGKFYREFTISEVIDKERIEAAYNDGVLRLTLPKVQKTLPRKITVRAG